MGTKYSSKSASGYNASPPADDGTQVASNRVDWSKITGKVGAPLKTFIEAVNSALVTHFDVGPDAKTAAYSVAASDYGKVITATGDRTISLPDATTVGAGFNVTVATEDTGTTTVDLTTASDTLNGLADGAITLPHRGAMTFIANSSANGYTVIGESQGWLPKGVCFGLNLSNGTDADHDIDITAGTTVDTTGVYRMTATATTTIAIDGSVGLNALTTGTSAADTPYAVWMVMDPTTGGTGYVFDTSFTWAGVTKTNITDYTVGQLVGAVVTDSTTPGNIVPFTHYDKYFELNGAVQAYNGGPAADITFETITLAPCPPSSLVDAWCFIQASTGTEQALQLQFRAVGSATTVNSGRGGYIDLVSGSAIDIHTVPYRFGVDSSSQVQMSATENAGTTTVQVNLSGFLLSARGNAS